LKDGAWVRRVRFVMPAPDPRHLCRSQAEIPLIGLSEFGQPSLLLQAVTAYVGMRYFPCPKRAGYDIPRQPCPKVQTLSWQLLLRGPVLDYCGCRQTARPVRCQVAAAGVPKAVCAPVRGSHAVGHLTQASAPTPRWLTPACLRMQAKGHEQPFQSQRHGRPSRGTFAIISRAAKEAVQLDNLGCRRAEQA
jgi:hypothetical protein